MKNDVLEHCSYLLSHDLQSPLETIKTFLSYLEDIIRGDSETIQKDMSFIHTAVKKMNGLIDDLLKLSQAGRAAQLCVKAPLREITPPPSDPPAREGKFGA